MIHVEASIIINDEKISLKIIVMILSIIAISIISIAAEVKLDSFPI